MSRYPFQIVPILLICLLCHADLPAQIIGSKPNDLPPFRAVHYICYRTGVAPTIDGKLDEAAWQAAQASSKFLDIEGTRKAQPAEETQFKMLWDDTNLYLGVSMQESDIWGRIQTKDSLVFHDNAFEIFIDPDGDTHNYFEFQVNALGTIWDLLMNKPYRDGGPSISAWDLEGVQVGQHFEGSLNDPSDRDSLWTLEIALPWKVLVECAPGKHIPYPKDQWRMNFSRVEHKLISHATGYTKQLDSLTQKPLSPNYWVWAPQGKVNLHMPEMWGYVQFSPELVGEGFDRFYRNGDEEIKWALRQVYYKQAEYKKKTQNYSKTLTELGLFNMTLRGKKLTPYIETTSHSFHASMGSPDGVHIWYIRDDGKIWKK